MNCGQVQEKLSCYLDGVLDEATLEAIEAHLDACADCRAELEALSAVIELTADVAEVEPPAYLSMAIKDAVEKERETAGECVAYLPMLSEYIDGELQEAERASVEAHVASCECCAEELVMLKETVSLVAAAVEVDPPAALRGRIAAATTGRKRVAPAGFLLEKLQSIFTMPRLGWAAGAAAAAAVVAGAWVAMPNASQEQSTVAVAPETPPSVTAKAPEAPAPKPEDSVTVSTPAEKTIEAAVAKAAKRSKRARVRVVEAKPVDRSEKPAPVVAARPVSTKPAAMAHRAVVDRTDPKPTPVKLAEDVKEETVAVKPTSEPATEKMETPEERILKIAVGPAKVEYPMDDFKDAKYSAQMRQRVDRGLRVDVINSKF